MYLMIEKPYIFTEFRLSDKKGGKSTFIPMLDLLLMQNMGMILKRLMEFEFHKEFLEFKFIILGKS